MIKDKRNPDNLRAGDIIALIERISYVEYSRLAIIKVSKRCIYTYVLMDNRADGRARFKPGSLNNFQILTLESENVNPTYARKWRIVE